MSKLRWTYRIQESYPGYFLAVWCHKGKDWYSLYDVIKREKLNKLSDFRLVFKRLKNRIAKEVKGTQNG